MAAPRAIQGCASLPCWGTKPLLSLSRWRRVRPPVHAIDGKHQRTEGGTHTTVCRRHGSRLPASIQLVPRPAGHQHPAGGGTIERVHDEGDERECPCILAAKFKRNVRQECEGVFGTSFTVEVSDSEGSAGEKRGRGDARQIRRDQVSFEVSELGWLRRNCLMRATHPTTAGTLLRLSAAGSACGGRKCGSVHQGIECESGRTRCRVVAARRGAAKPQFTYLYFNSPVRTFFGRACARLGGSGDR